MTTTPNEFLQFAKDMGFEQMKSTSLTNNNHGYSLTGLSVLNNLCHLIEQIHTLKAENDRLRAHLDLLKHVDKFLLKKEDNKTRQVYDEEESLTLSPSNSLKIKIHNSPNLSISSRERQGVDSVNNQEDSSSMMHIESEMMDSNSGLSAVPTWNHWNKVRHALKFSIRRKPDPSPPTNPVLTIPAISISSESNQNYLQDNKRQKKKKELITTNDNRRDFINEDADRDDESIDLNTIHQKQESYRNNRINSSTNDINSPMTTMPVEDENLLSRKQSKIAHYRHKIRSKLHTVKKQFSDQNLSSSSSRLFSATNGSTLNDGGSGFNHALLTVKLAPAMTKSYQQKMREWQTMQKSNFLVNYRRQSILNKNELKNDSRKTSVISTINEISDEQQILSTDESIPDTKTDISTLGPTFSPYQRSLIVHQWREIMSEEISLRNYNEYFQRKLQELKQLETDLKSLKTSIFCTTNQDYFLKHRSMTSINQLDQDLLDQHQQTSLSRRCGSLQSLISMPASWILAVQSAAYSDILDGTSKKTTDRAIIFNKHFFNQLQHFKNDRINFEQETFKNLPVPTNSKTNNSYEDSFNAKRSIRTRPRILLTRGYLHKLSFISPTEIPPINPMTLFQTTISKLETSSHIDLLTTSEIESTLPSSSSSTLNKRSKRSRFDFRKTLQRSKSICMTQFHSWLQRRRQQHHYPSVFRRKSAFDSKINKDLLSSPCSSPRLLASPRLARLHQRLFKQYTSPSSPVPLKEFPSSPSPPLLDDSDQQFKKPESPIRIYLPVRTSPTTRHVRIIDNEIKTPPMSKITSPIITRRYFSSSIQITTAKERRESYAALSNILNHQ